MRWLRRVKCLLPFLLVPLLTSRAAGQFNYPNATGSTWESALSIQKRGTVFQNKVTRYDLAFIEFGEEGSNRDASQLPFAKKLIEARQNPLVFIFVHGWHHNSSPTDNDVVRFNHALGLLADHIPTRQVVGIDLGWPGETLHFLGPLNSPFNYYTRKSAAERLANNYGCVNAIGTLLQAAHEKGGHSILAGHSFGGLVVERAIKASLVNPSATGENVILRDTLVLMLNPATESILTREIMEEMVARVRYDPAKRAYVLRENGEHFSGANEPLVTSITTTNDSATGVLFPFSSWVWTVFHPTRGFQRVHAPASEADIAAAQRSGTQLPTLAEHEFFRHTPGHEPHLQNMTVCRLGDLPLTNTPAVLENLHTTYRPGERTFVTSAKKQKESEGASEETWNSAPRRTKWAIDRAVGPDHQPKNADIPYWIIEVGPEIINNHGGIWNDNSVAMVAALYRMKFPQIVGGKTAPPSAMPSLKSHDVPPSYLGPAMQTR